MNNRDPNPPPPPLPDEDRFTWQKGDVGFSKDPAWDLTVREDTPDGGYEIRLVRSRADMDTWLRQHALTFDEFVAQYPDKFNLIPSEIEESYYPFSDFMPLEPGQHRPPVKPL